MSANFDPRWSPSRMRQARRSLIERGEPVGAQNDPLNPVLARSWLRSRQAGLPPDGRSMGAPHASGEQLARALERQHELVAHARPVMEFLFEQTRDTDCMVILADSRGMLLHAQGDPSFIDRAERVALRPGATWHEQYRGTNAIGTALMDAASVVVHGAEHYLERNGFLTCAAAPILDPSGQLLGVIDISGDHRRAHPHTLGLVRSGSRMIEHRLFDTRHHASLRLRFHRHAEGIGTLTEALLALSPDGWIIGANSVALDWLGLSAEQVNAVRIEQVFALDAVALEAWQAQPSAAPRRLPCLHGEPMWARLDQSRPTVSISVAAVRPVMGSVESRPADAVAIESGTVVPPVAVDALAALDTGDTTLQAVIARARRVLDKPIALLLRGESGVGKEVFARAVHASGPRRGGPLVAVNCAALPETLIEAELFGYSADAYTGARREGAPGRIREAHGGTLFLDEIGDMPLAMQGRLLRVLQERQVVPLGGGKPVPVDFALICATHRRLRDEIQAGRFREDLYYRLNGLSLQLPALRERQDLPDLMQRLLADMAPGRPVQVAPDLAQALHSYRWPGNLRQLSNALRTACALLADDEQEINWSHLPDDLAEDLQVETISHQIRAFKIQRMSS
ncbi:MAG: sigma-54-dependent Fis family transcriptional regulator [Leptothrix sp. (in: b-proteobacteria)]